MINGRIIKAMSGEYVVDTNKGVFTTRPRGIFRHKNNAPKVGDFVDISTTDEEHDQSVIVHIHPRKNEFIRPAVSNIDYLAIVMSVKSPTIDWLLIDKFICSSLYNETKPILILTKCDLLAEDDYKALEQYKLYYDDLDISLLFSINNHHLNQLKSLIKDHVVVLTGQTGVGKSTLINKLDQSKDLETQEISTKLGRGKHTTRHIELFPFKGGYIGDSPGFSQLDVSMIEMQSLKHYFEEFNRFSQSCKFRECLHHREPKCQVKKAVEEGSIMKHRYDHYIHLLEAKMNEKPKY